MRKAYFNTFNQTAAFNLVKCSETIKISLSEPYLAANWWSAWLVKAGRGRIDLAFERFCQWRS